MASTRSGFVKIGDFEGEASDSKHKGWSIMYWLSAPLTRATGGFEAAGIGASLKAGRGTGFAPSPPGRTAGRGRGSTGFGGVNSAGFAFPTTPPGAM